MLCYVMLYNMLCYVILYITCYVMLCYITCYVMLFIYFTQAEIHASRKQDPQAVATSVYWLRMVIPVTVPQASFCFMITRHVIPQVTLASSKCNSFLKSLKACPSYPGFYRRIFVYTFCLINICFLMKLIKYKL